jgi:D-amino peptidase
MTPSFRAAPSRRATTNGLPVAFLLVVFLSAGVLEAQQRLKVYVSIDMEGIAGVVSLAQTSPSGHDYEWARAMMTAEANAAVRGAFDAGATEVLVNDSHGPQTNIRPDELDRRARLITGAPKRHAMVQGLDSSFDAVVFIGYHAHGSTADAVQDHTFSGSLKHVSLNGREVGEYGMNAAMAWHYGVPVVFISGDRAATDQAREFIPGIEVLAVKEAIGQTAASTMHPLDARDRIASGVKSAVAHRAAMRQPRLATPVTLEVELGQTNWADAAMLVPGMKRTSGRVVSYTAPDMPTAYRVCRLLLALARD